MKQTIKKIVSLLVVLCLSMSVLALVACNKDPEDKVTIDDIKFEDRANYNVQNVEAAYMENSLYDIMYVPETASKNMKGYLLGDVYNMVINQAKMPMTLDQGSNQVNLDVFMFTRDTEGNWRNYNKAEVHPIMNKLLNYKLDSNEDFVLTEADLTTYGNVQLFSLLRESVAKTEVVYKGTTVGENNAQLTANLNNVLNGLYESLSVPMVKQTLDATVADFTKLVAGTPEEQGNAFNKIYGSVKVSELAALVTTPDNLPAEVVNMTLSDVKAWVDEVNKNGGFGVYFEQMFTQMTQAVMAMTMGDVALNFGYELPDNLAAYTVAEVVAELQAMMGPTESKPNDPNPQTPAPTAEGDATTGTTTETEQPKKSFFAEFEAYFAAQDIPFSETVVLKGQELINFVEQLTAILTKSYEGTTTLEQLDGMIVELNKFVTDNETVMTNVVASFDSTGVTVSFDGVTELLPSEAFALVKDFLKKGKTYQQVVSMLTNTTVEQYLMSNSVSVLPTGVKKVDDFANKYKAVKLADFINNFAAFQEELVTLEASLTISEEIALSGYGYILENAAVKTFMATYGNMTEAELNEKLASDIEFADAYEQAMMTLFKNLKLKDLMPPMPAA